MGHRHSRNNSGEDAWRQRPTYSAANVRTAVRRLAGQPAATALTVLTLALAIGVAAAVFSVVDQLILRPPPFLHADRLVNVWHQTGPNGSGGSGLSPEINILWLAAAARSVREAGSLYWCVVRLDHSRRAGTRPGSRRVAGIVRHARHQDAHRTAVRRGGRRTGQRKGRHPLSRVLADADDQAMLSEASC